MLVTCPALSSAVFLAQPILTTTMRAMVTYVISQIMWSRGWKSWGDFPEATELGSDHLGHQNPEKPKNLASPWVTVASIYLLSHRSLFCPGFQVPINLRFLLTMLTAITITLCCFITVTISQVALSWLSHLCLHKLSVKLMGHRHSAALPCSPILLIPTALTSPRVLPSDARFTREP